MYKGLDILDIPIPAYRPTKIHLTLYMLERAPEGCNSKMNEIFQGLL